MKKEIVIKIAITIATTVGAISKTQASTVKLECRTSSSIVQVVDSSSIYKLSVSQGSFKKVFEIKKVSLDKNKFNKAGDRKTKIIELESDVALSNKFYTLLEVNFEDGSKSKVNGKNAVCYGLSDSSTYDFRDRYQSYFDRYDQNAGTVNVVQNSICTKVDPKSNGYSAKCLNYEDVDNDGNYCAEYDYSGGYGSNCKVVKNICIKYSEGGYGSCLEYRN